MEWLKIDLKTPDLPRQYVWCLVFTDWQTELLANALFQLTCKSYRSPLRKLSCDNTPEIVFLEYGPNWEFIVFPLPSVLHSHFQAINYDMPAEICVQTEKLQKFARNRYYNLDIATHSIAFLFLIHSVAVHFSHWMSFLIYLKWGMGQNTMTFCHEIVSWTENRNQNFDCDNNQ